jgi:hypothetical protein
MRVSGTIAAIAFACAGTARAQELISILPVEDVTVIDTEPYQYSTTWTDESGATYEHTTTYSPDGSSIEYHYIDGALAGTLYSDVEGNWTFLDGTGTLIYADAWDDKAGDYVVLYGDFASYSDFDEQVLMAMNFWGAPSLYYGDDIYIGIAYDSAVLTLASADGGSTTQAPAYTVTGALKGILNALAKVKPNAVTARAILLNLAATQPKAPATPVKGAKRAAPANRAK